MTVDVHTLSGAYALDALSPEEAEAFRSHLASCASCAEEVEEFRSAAAHMGSAEMMAPPPALKAKVLAAAARTPQLPPVPAAAPTAPAAEAPAQRSGSGDAGGIVIPLRRSWLPRLAAAAAAVVLVGGGVAILSQQGSEDPQLSVAASAVFEADDARTVTVETRNGGELTVGVSRARNEMAVDTRDLPQLDPEHVYQIWSVTNGVMASQGLVTDLDTGAAMALPGDDALVAITVEPRGGSESPTTKPIISVDPAKV